MYSAELSREKDEFYQTKIGEAAGGIKNLYAVTSDLL